MIHLGPNHDLAPSGHAPQRTVERVSTPGDGPGSSVGPMTDVDTSVPAPPASAPPGPGASFPPPPPAPAPTPTPEADGRISKMLILIALVSLGIALITTVLWLGARGDSDAIDAGTDTGTTVPAAAEPDAEAAAQLDEAEARIAALEAEVATLEAADDDAELRQAEADLAQAQLDLDEATTALAEATASNAELDAALVAANERITELENEAAESVDQADTPEFDRWIGELLSSRSGSSRLGADDAACFGRSVIDQIGLDALGAGQNNVATGASRQVVIDAMVSAAAACGIDQALIFS